MTAANTIMGCRCGSRQVMARHINHRHDQFLLLGNESWRRVRRPSLRTAGANPDEQTLCLWSCSHSRRRGKLGLQYKKWRKIKWSNIDLHIPFLHQNQIASRWENQCPQGNLWGRKVLAFRAKVLQTETIQRLPNTRRHHLAPHTPGLIMAETLPNTTSKLPSQALSFIGVRSQAIRMLLIPKAPRRTDTDIVPTMATQTRKLNNFWLLSTQNQNCRG